MEIWNHFQYWHTIPLLVEGNPLSNWGIDISVIEGRPKHSIDSILLLYSNLLRVGTRLYSFFSKTLRYEPSSIILASSQINAY